MKLRELLQQIENVQKKIGTSTVYICGGVPRDRYMNRLDNIEDIDLKNLVDPTHRGFKDIKERMIRTCLDPQITLTTNKNRVIRAVYLAAKLDFDVDPQIINFVRQNPQTVNIATNKVLSEKMVEAF